MNMRRRALAALNKENLLAQSLLNKNGVEGALVTGLNLCGSDGLPNQGLACAIKLAEAGYKVIGHIDPSVKSETIERIRLYFKNAKASFVIASFGETPWQKKIAEEIITNKISNMQIICYESFTSYLPQERKNNPFLPFYEEIVHNDFSRMMTRRVKGIQWLLKLACNLLLVSNQEKLFFQSISSLAAHRDGGNLFIDGLHKKIGSSTLHSGLIDLSHVLYDDQLYALELLPGIVKGGYETNEVKNALNFRSSKGVKNFIPNIGWPEITPMEVAEISFAYSEWFKGAKNSLIEAENKFQKYLWAGRCPDQLIYEECRELPAYCHLGDINWGKLPKLQANRVIHLPLVPFGQLF